MAAALLAGAYLLYLGVMAGVRSYTSGRIARMEGAALPSFSLTSRDGVRFDNAALRGKPAVLNFFRSKCHGCDAEQADIRALVDEVHPARATVLGIMVDEVQGFPAAVTERTLQAFRYRHPILMADAAFVDAFHGAGWSHITPITYVVDAEGTVVASFRHPYELDALRAALALP